MLSTEFLQFKVQHETALSDLRSYALNSQDDADCLNPILHAADLAAMVRAAPSLRRYKACSVFIDELHDALITIAAKGGVS